MDYLVCIEASTIELVYCVVKVTRPETTAVPVKKDGTRTDIWHMGVCLFLYLSYTTLW